MLHPTQWKALKAAADHVLAIFMGERKEVPARRKGTLLPGGRLIFNDAKRATVDLMRAFCKGRIVNLFKIALGSTMVSPHAPAAMCLAAQRSASAA